MRRMFISLPYLLKIICIMVLGFGAIFYNLMKYTIEESTYSESRDYQHRAKPNLRGKAARTFKMLFWNRNATYMNRSEIRVIKQTRQNEHGRDQRQTQNPLPSITAKISEDFPIIPSFVDFFPHLKDKSNNELHPALIYPNNLTSARNISIVIGISTVTRDKYYYLNVTLNSLISGLSVSASKSVVIVIMTADESGDVNSSFVTGILASLSTTFQQYFDSGLLQLIVPPHKWYPANLTKIPTTFNDPPERMYWRTKQCLDFMYLILYCQQKGQYYLHLEDDVVAVLGYIEMIEKFIQKMSDKDWLMLEFSRMGFIGKLFRSADLKMLVQFIALFYQQKPVDWLLDLLFVNRYCHPEKSPALCSKYLSRHYRIPHYPPLFYHIGTFSSLPGKVLNFKDKKFARNLLTYVPHVDNPAATRIETSLKTTPNHGVDDIYYGRNYCRASPPKVNDFVSFIFRPPINMSCLFIATGNVKHPGERLGKSAAKIEYRPSSGYRKYEFHFAADGTAGVAVNAAVSVEAIFIVFREDWPKWVTISEIHVIAS